MTIANFIIFAVLMAIFWNVVDLKREQRMTSNMLGDLTQTLRDLAEYIDHSNEKEENTIRAINEMCKALNQSFSTTGTFMNHSSCALRNIVVCMIPFIDEVKARALANEEYEKAQECVNIINNLRELVKPDK